MNLNYLIGHICALLFMTMMWSCVNKQAPATDSDGVPFVSYYNMTLDVDIAHKQLTVLADVDIDFQGKDSIDLSLWNDTDIKSIKYRKKQVAYLFDQEKHPQWIGQGGLLRVSNPSSGKGIKRLTFDYSCHLDSLDDDESWMCTCDSDWVQLNFYMAWYPLSTTSQHVTGDVQISIDNRFQLTGSGLISKQKDKWVMHQPWESYDFVIAGSPDLKKKMVTADGQTVEVDYTDLPVAEVDSVAAFVSSAFTYFSSLYGHVASEYPIKFLLISREVGGAFSRRNFVATEYEGNNESLHKLMGHELGHFWWNHAPTDSWEDWLNESFAEFSSLWLVRRNMGERRFNDYLNFYRELSADIPPIYNIPRSSDDAYRVLYRKGALLLCDLEQEVGEERFFGFMNQLASKRVGNHESFMEVVRSQLGEEWAVWIDRRLRE